MTTRVQRLVRYGVQVTFLLTLFAAVSANAATWHTAKITLIYQLADGRYVLQFDSDSIDCTSNSSPDYYYVAVGYNSVTQEAHKNMLSLAMTAATVGADVTINYDETSTGCEVNRLFVNFAS